MRPEDRQKDEHNPTGHWPLLWVFVAIFAVSGALWLLMTMNNAL